jgi:hypothetical protein
MAKRKKYDVLSPDGFSIHFSDTYTSKKKAFEAVKEWAKGFERQGYYSSLIYGRIPLGDIVEYCSLVEV